MKNNKSAKDIAFEKERIKFRKDIKDLEEKLHQSKIKVANLNQTLQDKDSEIERLNDWIARLLEYMNLSEEDMKKIIQKDKDMATIVQNIMPMFSLIGKYNF